MLLTGFPCARGEPGKSRRDSPNPFVLSLSKQDDRYGSFSTFEMWQRLLTAAHFQEVMHSLSPSFLPRYVAEFSDRHNVRSPDTIDQMRALALGVVGKLLRYEDLIR